MKRIVSASIIAVSLMIAPHWERRAFHRVWIEGYWRY
jgi:hypothetical protein